MDEAEAMTAIPPSPTALSPPTVRQSLSEDSNDSSSSIREASNSSVSPALSETIPFGKVESLVVGEDEGIYNDFDESESSILLPGNSHHGDASTNADLTDSVANFVFPNKTEDLGDDPFLESSDQQQTAMQFAMEHRIFLRAALSLLSERDARATTLGMMDPMVLKAGPLKKASHLMNGVWKVKYVEIRRGMFTYYENAINDGEILRKNIPLHATNSSCRPVRLHQKALKFTPGGALFELTGEGSKRLWMATSREERQNWINAIQTATVGGSVTTSETNHSGRIRTVSPRSPFRKDLRLYLKTQNLLKQATSKDDYLAGLKEIASKPIKVPINWIAKQAVLSGLSNGGPAEAAIFKEQDLAESVDQLWRDLQRDSVSINGVVWHGNTAHGAEAIVGAVAHSILRSSRQSTEGDSDMMESQSLAYARDIMLAGNRTRSGGDSYFCISTLCDNSELVVLTPSAREAEPVALAVNEENLDTPNAEGRVKTKTGWLKRRTKLQRAWRAYFFVLSEGTLSFYEGALPRPHGLKGVISMDSATISVRKGRSKDAKYWVITITAKDGKEHFCRVDNEPRLVEWLFCMEREAKAKAGTEAPNRFHIRRKSASHEEDLATDGTKLAQQATEAHALKLGMDVAMVKERIASSSTQTTSAVRINVQACTEYNVVTLDPSGDPIEDTWAVIRAHFQQSFRVTGGTGGRISRGEEVVKVSLIQIGGKDVVQYVNDSSNRARLGSRIFRKPAGEEKDEAEV